MKSIILILSFLLLTAFNVFGTTWYPKDVQCPICQQNNTFQVVGSYGSYIYQWESKYQLIFWPTTEDQSVYCCNKCFYSQFLWDFDSIPPGKELEIKEALKSFKLEKFTDYTKVPTSERLKIAKRIYEIKGFNNVDWCFFYRVLGYHYFDEKKFEEAKQARAKAIEYAELIKKEKGLLKEYDFIIASMTYFIDKKKEALELFSKMKDISYKTPEMKNAENFSKYLDEIIAEFIENIKKEI